MFEGNMGKKSIKRKRKERLGFARGEAKYAYLSGMCSM